MKVLKQFKGEDTWTVISLEEAIEYTEGSGYWKKGTVKQMLKAGTQVHTPTAFYKADQEIK